MNTFEYYSRRSVWTITLLAALFVYPAAAQEGVLNVGLPSPTAASLGKFGEIPVSPYTGVANNSIPLYEVSIGNIGFDIQLRYHASGNKVDEVPGWAGLGWAVQAGGVISRSRRDVPDEQTNGYLDSAPTLASVMPVVDANDIYNALGETTPYDIDTEPDLFSYNFGPYSGSFVFDVNGDVVTFPTTDLKFSFDSQLTSWTVTAEDGTKYIFSHEEVSKDNWNQPNEVEYTSSWYLTEIESVSGNHAIQLDYQLLGAQNKQESLYSEEIFFIEAENPSTTTCELDGSSTTESEVTNQVLVQGLDKITVNDEVIQFYSSDRQHSFTKAGKLDSIVVEKNGIHKKSFEFNYDYFSGTDQRLKLTGLQIKGDSLEQPPYSFTYNESVTMPERLSKEQDHWGFYTQEADTIYTFPEVYSPDLEAFLPGNNREPTEDGSMAYMLTRIDYPTGGHTEFEYEVHDFGYFGGGDESFEYVPDSLWFAVPVADPGQTDQDEEEFQVGGSASVPVSIITSFNHTAGGPPSEPAYVELFDASDQSLYRVEDNDCQGNYFNPPENVMNLAPGTYTLVLQSNDCASTSTITNWRNKENSKKVKAGGVRIKQVSSFPATPDDGADPMIKKYEYVTTADTDRSSGILLIEPSYGMGVAAMLQQGSSDIGTCNVKMRATSLQSPLGTSKGSHVVYSEVREIFGENGESGMNKYFYRSPDDFPDDPSGDFPNLVSYDWERGQLNSQETYDSSSNLIRDIENQFEYFEFESEQTTAPYEIPSLKRRTIPIDTESGSQKYAQIFTPAYLKTGWLFREKETVTNHDGGSSLARETEHFYENTDNFLLTKKIESNSDGQQRKTEYTYAHEEYSAMEGHHMLGQPYKVTIRDETDAILRIDWTLWDEYTTSGGDFWQPCARYAGGSEFGTGEPAGCN
ncbi:MAG: hypothetical protein WD529_06770 [Balneolaceae bacterium]